MFRQLKILKDKTLIMEGRKFKLLIVDDIPENIQVLGNILRSAGYEVAFTDNGHDAIEKSKIIDFDLILLDIMMPQMDGFEVSRIIKSNPKSQKIPIIFITAKTDSDSIVKGFELGAVDYLTKPFKTPELLARVRTHIMLKYSTEELRKSNAMKDKLFSIIAHDLRGPVGNLGTSLDVLIDNFDYFDKEVLFENLNELKKSASRAYELLQNLLKWSRSQSNTIEFSPLKFKLKKLVDDNIELLSGMSSEKSIRFETSVDGEIFIQADINMLRTILRNLFNALKFSFPDSTIFVSAVKKENMVEVSVKDNGVGIEKENMAKLFVPHEHFTTYGTKNEKGTGIGLNLCKDFVERNGGKIYVESEAGKGTKFIFTVPLADEDE